MNTKWLAVLQTPSWISIILGACLLIWGQVQGEISPVLQNLFFCFFILISGIPHGALDHLVASETAQRQKRVFKLPWFMVEYLLSMAAYAVAWFLFPTLSLFFFLLIAAWHFGESDLEGAPSTFGWNAAKFLFGAWVLAFILLAHPLETGPLWARITQNESLASLLWESSRKHSLLILGLIGVAFFLLVFFAYRQSVFLPKQKHLLQLTLVLLLSYFLPLLPAFALYFGGWHAVNTFGHINQYINQSAPLKSKINLRLWLKSLPFTAMAAGFLGLAFWFWQTFLHTWDPLPLVFIFLSLITLPHLRVMHRMNERVG